MDGGGRLLRSIGEWSENLAPSSLAFAGSNDPFAFPKPTAPSLPIARRRRQRQTTLAVALRRGALSRYLGTVLVLGLLSSTIAFGAWRGGEYEGFVAANGSVPDILAKAVGFSIKSVTITGVKELSEHEVLSLAGVSTRNSLVFLDVAGLRARLKAAPLIKDASVTKLYPNRLVIEIEERAPTALWQKDGEVSIVAADGTPIDDLHDARFERLPLVVGADANAHLSDYTAILDASGDLRDRVRAGIFVSGRRWTLRTDNGLDIDLPEDDPTDAIARFARLEHDSHVLEKDILSVDLRIPGRVVARLSADAAATRAGALAQKAKKKGATT